MARGLIYREPCSVEGCETRAQFRGMCKSHYCKEKYRALKAGTWEPKPPRQPDDTVVRKDGYVLRLATGHPLAMTSGYILEHRFQAYQKYGPGEQTCHWCSTPLEWKSLHVDHLDWQRTNNDPDNLVTSCPSCNVRRTQPRSEQTAPEPSPLASKLMGLALRNRD